MADVENKILSSSAEVFSTLSDGVFAIPADNAIPKGVEGSYKAHFLIALESDNGALWNLKAFKELRRLIQSMKIKRKALSTQDVGFINLKNHSFEHLAQLIDYTEPEYMMLLSSSWPFKEVEIRKHETQKVGSVNVLRLPALEEIKLNTDNKQKTWNSIKRYLDM